MTHHHHPAARQSDADETLLAVIFACVFEFKGDAGEHLGGILKIQHAIAQGLLALFRIAGNSHDLL